MSTEFITEYYPNGNKHVEGYYDGFNPAGDFTMWHENGNKQWEGFDVNSDDSLYMSTSWYESGQIKDKGEMHLLIWKTGLWTEWHENGNKRSEGHYLGEIKSFSDFDKTDEDENPRIGEWSYWHSNGQLACTGRHKDYRIDGLWVFWDEAGYKVHERLYKDNEFLGVGANLRASGCSDELVDKYKQYIFH